jgi:hypothetical protein
VNKLPGERNPEEFTIRELEIQVQTGGLSLGLWEGTGPILVLLRPAEFLLKSGRQLTAKCERYPAAFTLRELEIQVQTGGPRLGLWKGTGPILMSSCCHPKRFVVEFSRNSAGIQQELSRNWTQGRGSVLPFHRA